MRSPAPSALVARRSLGTDLPMIGQVLGPYQVLSKLGEGGMGEVFRARGTKLNREVAIKGPAT